MRPPLILPIRTPNTGTKDSAGNTNKIAKGASLMYQLHQDPLKNYAEDYAPFNYFTIQNLSSVTVQIIFNYNATNYLIVPSGAFQTRHPQAYCNFQIINLDGTLDVNSNELTIIVEKVEKI